MTKLILMLVAIIIGLVWFAVVVWLTKKGELLRTEERWRLH